MFRPRLPELDRPVLREDEPRDPDERTLGWLLRAGALRTDPPLELGRDLTAGCRLLGVDRTVRFGVDGRWRGGLS